MNAPWDIQSVQIIVTNHFSWKYLSPWRWDYSDLRDAIANAYRIEQVGKCKSEIYVQKGGFKKIVTAYYEADNELICITGSEGGHKI